MMMVEKNLETRTWLYRACSVARDNNDQVRGLTRRGLPVSVGEIWESHTTHHYSPRRAPDPTGLADRCAECRLVTRRRPLLCEWKHGRVGKGEEAKRRDGRASVGGRRRRETGAPHSRHRNVRSGPSIPRRPRAKQAPEQPRQIGANEQSKRSKSGRKKRRKRKYGHATAAIHVVGYKKNGTV
jgi:hypothetical protein